MNYKKGYKYKLVDDFVENVGVTGAGFLGGWINLSNGVLAIRSGYAWDGASGPAFDTPNIMRASLVHDALYQLMREGKLPLTERKNADKILYMICRENGMSWARAWYIYLAVRLFGNWVLRHDSSVKEAP